MIVRILGVGCPKCRKLEERVKAVIERNSFNATVEKVTDVNEMMKYNIMMTPGLVINEKLKSGGIIPKEEQIHSWLQEELSVANE
ncbi:MAG: thioredoxin family protein [Ignavibacteria bacterium]|jgi:small redox-active disulfide protein 2|nr:thioredoxin family protein [Ignavibacteria bacterium]MBK9225688.1 thioredoxin family protein [Ignavibacteria bacterium]